MIKRLYNGFTLYSVWLLLHFNHGYPTTFKYDVI